MTEHLIFSGTTCLSYSLVPLLMIASNVQCSFLEVLQPQLLPLLEMLESHIFEHDIAPPHVIL